MSFGVSGLSQVPQVSHFSGLPSGDLSDKADSFFKHSSPLYEVEDPKQPSPQSQSSSLNRLPITNSDLLRIHQERGLQLEKMRSHLDVLDYLQSQAKSSPLILDGFLRSEQPMQKAFTDQRPSMDFSLTNKKNLSSSKKRSIIQSIFTTNTPKRKVEDSSPEGDRFSDEDRVSHDQPLPRNSEEPGLLNATCPEIEGNSSSMTKPIVQPIHAKNPQNEVRVWHIDDRVRTLYEDERVHNFYNYRNTPLTANQQAELERRQNLAMDESNKKRRTLVKSAADFRRRCKQTNRNVEILNQFESLKKKCENLEARLSTCQNYCVQKELTSLEQRVFVQFCD